MMGRTTAYLDAYFLKDPKELSDFTLDMECKVIGFTKMYQQWRKHTHTLEMSKKHQR